MRIAHPRVPSSSVLLLLLLLPALASTSQCGRRGDADRVPEMENVLFECLGEKAPTGGGWDRLIDMVSSYSSTEAEGAAASFSAVLFGGRASLELAVAALARSMYVDVDAGGIRRVQLSEPGFLADAQHRDGRAVAVLKEDLRSQVTRCPKESLVILDHMELVRGARVPALNAYLEPLNANRCERRKESGVREGCSACARGRGGGGGQAIRPSKAREGHSCTCCSLSSHALVVPMSLPVPFPSPSMPLSSTLAPSQSTINHPHLGHHPTMVHQSQTVLRKRPRDQLRQHGVHSSLRSEGGGPSPHESVSVFPRRDVGLRRTRVHRVRLNNLWRIRRGTRMHVWHVCT